jgi:hypothetical protein
LKAPDIPILRQAKAEYAKLPSLSGVFAELFGVHFPEWSPSAPIRSALFLPYSPEIQN